jgi:hypothetical protein
MIRKQTNQFIAGRPSFYFIVLETSVEVRCKVILKKYIRVNCQILEFQMYFQTFHMELILHTLHLPNTCFSRSHEFQIDGHRHFFMWTMLNIVTNMAMLQHPTNFALLLTYV